MQSGGGKQKPTDGTPTPMHVRGSKTKFVTVDNDTIRHGSDFFSKSKLDAFFASNSCQFVPGYHTSRAKNKAARLAFIEESIDEPELREPVPGWFENSMMASKDFR